VGGGRLPEEKVSEEHLTVPGEPFPKHHYTNKREGKFVELGEVLRPWLEPRQWYEEHERAEYRLYKQQHKPLCVQKESDGIFQEAIHRGHWCSQWGKEPI
jgi:hypothetical protein